MNPYILHRWTPVLVARNKLKFVGYLKRYVTRLKPSNIDCDCKPNTDIDSFIKIQGASHGATSPSVLR